MSTSKPASKASSLPATSRTGWIGLPVSEFASNMGRRRCQGQTATHNILGRRERFDYAPFFWTEQYDFGIAYVGHAERWDKAAIDGSLDRRDCTTARIGKSWQSLSFTATSKGSAPKSNSNGP